jgi:hypothetical protein
MICTGSSLAHPVEGIKPLHAICLTKRGSRPKKFGKGIAQLRDADPGALINTAIEVGSREGISALDADQRLVYLISEAEVFCDMEGIDAFLDRYFPQWMEETAAAFAELGAAEIATGLRAIAANTVRNDSLLGRVNELITSRAGYDYETIRKAVERRAP